MAQEVVYYGTGHPQAGQIKETIEHPDPPAVKKVLLGGEFAVYVATALGATKYAAIHQAAPWVATLLGSGVKVKWGSGLLPGVLTLLKSNGVIDDADIVTIETNWPKV